MKKMVASLVGGLALFTAASTQAAVLYSTSGQISASNDGLDLNIGLIGFVPKDEVLTLSFTTNAPLQSYQGGYLLLWEDNEWVDWQCTLPVCSNGVGWQPWWGGETFANQTNVTDPRSFTFTHLIRQPTADPGPPTYTYSGSGTVPGAFRSWETSYELILTFAPDVPDSSYSLTISDATPAPEPAVWTLMLAGMFGLGALLRRKNEQSLASAV